MPPAAAVLSSAAPAVVRCAATPAALPVAVVTSSAAGSASDADAESGPGGGLAPVPGAVQRVLPCWDLRQRPVRGQLRQRHQV